VKRNVHKSSMKKFMEASLGNTVNNTGLDSFLQYDRHVLRFTGVWDNKDAMFGDFNFYTIHYYLADNTVEVLEQHQPNNGKDPYPLLLKRYKLPRKFNPDGPNGRADELNPSDFVHWTDLDCKKHIQVYGRSVRLISADVKTREFYQAQGRPLAPDCEEEYLEQPNEPPRNQVPEHSGFGSEEDSKASCGALVPKAPKTQFDMQGVKLPSTVLRFAARMDTEKYDDKSRKFVIMYYLATNEIQVREPPQRNSGVVGGMYLSKMKVKRPDGSFFLAADFYAGATVKFNATTFIVTDVDEHTLRHMDENSDQFPFADADMCMQKIRHKLTEANISAKTLIEALDVNGNRKIGVGDFLASLKSVLEKNGVQTDSNFPEHVVITIFRAFDEGDGVLDLDSFEQRL